MFWTIVIIAIIAICLITTRNNFDRLRRAIQQQGSSIGIQMEKRAECLNDALNLLKLSHSNEVEGIRSLTANDQLNQLAFLGQKYPDLTSVQGYSETLREAFELNRDISASRELLNGNIRAYNDAISAFPACLLAKPLGFKPESFIDEENYEQNKKLNKTTVDFSRFS